MEIDAQRLDDRAYRQTVFTALMQAHEAAIRHYCVQRLGESVGDDVAQDVFVTAWANLSRYHPQQPVRAWLFGIASNKCLQAYRNRRRRAAIAHEFVADIRVQAHAAGSGTPEQVLLEQRQTCLDQARLQQLADCLARLRPADSIMLTLRYSRALPYREIAILEKISEAAVRKRLRRLLDRLREMMDNDPS